MSAATTQVPVEHCRARHAVRTTGLRDAGPLPTRPGRRRLGGSGQGISGQYTLLELIETIGEVTQDEREIVATVLHMLASGRVRLCGNFRDEPVESFQVDLAEAVAPS